GTPTEGWPRWMLNRLDWADLVLVVCTETYYRRFGGKEPGDKGKGADWEGQLITLEIYQSKSRTLKFIPILFNSADEKFIPEPLQGDTFYLLNSEVNYKRLLDFLLDQDGIVPREIGTPKLKPRKTIELLTFPSGIDKLEARAPNAPQIAPIRLRHGAERLFGREDELKLLDEAWANPKIHIATFVAFGGVGKTS